MSNSLTSYQQEIIEDIKECLEELKVPPIIFFGSGMSQRYMGTPNWIDLLNSLIKDIGGMYDVAYYQQDNNRLDKIGSTVANLYRDDAWQNKDQYPAYMFEANTNKNSYVKYAIKNKFKKITDSFDYKNLPAELQEEINLIKKIKPYSIVTTNYDEFLEKQFPDYTPVVGYETLRLNINSIGEIYKIHGSITNHDSLILTENDYVEFEKKGKYISAKLLTLFSEHPMFIFGYSANDPNIVEIFKNINEMLITEDKCVNNIFFVEYDASTEPDRHTPRVKIINFDGNELRLKCIKAKDFRWIFKTLKSSSPIENVDLKVLRSLSSRFYKLIRSDIPTSEININFEMLRKVDSDEEFATLFGIAGVGGKDINVTHPYIMKQCRAVLDIPNDYRLNKIIKDIEEKNNINIKSSDNNYHVAIRGGSNQVVTRKYSDEFIELIRNYINNEDLNLDLKPL